MQHLSQIYEDLLLWEHYPSASFALKENSQKLIAGADVQTRSGIPCAFSPWEMRRKLKLLRFQFSLWWFIHSPPILVASSPPYPHLLSHTCSFSISEILEIQIHLVLSDGKIVYHRQRRQGPGGAAALINGNPLILGWCERLHCPLCPLLSAERCQTHNSKTACPTLHQAPEVGFFLWLSTFE